MLRLIIVTKTGSGHKTQRKTSTQKEAVFLARIIIASATITDVVADIVLPATARTPVLSYALAKW